MTNHLISVIVPVYNVEPYLRQCLDSIVNQTYPNIEILIVDDGSPDRCGEICDEYAEKDSRIIVIHQENAGLSAARNAALDIARGEYIMFVDSDDWVEPIFCEKALEMALEYQVEIAIFGYYSVYQNKLIPNVTHTPRILDGTEAIQHIVLYDEPSLCNAVWNKIYHKRLFQNLRFPLGMTAEDAALQYKFLFLTPKVYVFDQCLYNYRKRMYSLAGSVCRQNKQYQCDTIQVGYERLAFLKEHFHDKKIIEQQTLFLAQRMIMSRSKLNKNNLSEKRVIDIMDSFIMENKAYLLSLPCNKYTRVYLYSKTIYSIYIKLAHLKGKLYSFIKTFRHKKSSSPESQALDFYM